LLAEKLTSYKGQPAIVVGLARGGVIVAKTIARALKLSVDVLIVKKIPSPFDPEFGLGAVAPDGVSFVDWRLAHRLGADEHYMNTKTLRLVEEIKQKELLYRKGMKPLIVKEKIVILVDDGIATGATFEAAIKWLRKKKAKKIVAAVPVAPLDIIAKIKPEVNNLVVIEKADNMGAVGQFYKNFAQVEDSEVVELLKDP